MPWWYEADKNLYKEVLDDDPYMSIDDDYDPEAGIEIKHFIIISRILNYK